MDKLGSNARGYRRAISFFVDVFFVNFLKTLLIQLVVLSKPKIIAIQEFIDNFKNLFGKVELTKLKDYHLRYIVNNSQIFDSLLSVLVIMSFAGMLYNFLCTFFLNSSTLGQKIFSLKVVDAKKDKKPGFLKLLVRAVLVPLPFVATFLFVIFSCLFFINFHIYAPQINWKISLLVKLVKFAEYQYLAVTMLVFFTIFWYNSYYLTDRLIFTDMLSMTRVIEVKKYDASSEDSKDFVYFGDKLLNFIERFNNFLVKLLGKILKYLGKKFTGPFRNKDR